MCALLRNGSCRATGEGLWAAVGKVSVPRFPQPMSLTELLGLLRFAPATRSHSRPPISLHEPEFFGAPRSLHCVDPNVESAQRKRPPMRAFAQRGHHSRASVARHEQVATPQHEQGGAECQYPGTPKILRSYEKSSETRPWHASKVRAASPGRGYLGPRAAGPFRTLGAIRLRGGRGGPWARGATRPASWPAVAARSA